MSGICARYNKAPIVAQTFEIQRNGKPGDTQTTYEIYRSDEPADDTKLEDFDMPEVLGSVVLDKTAEDMEFYLEEGYFPPDGEAPVRRSSNRETREMPIRRSGRRTPANHEDEF